MYKIVEMLWHHYGRYIKPSFIVFARLILYRLWSALESFVVLTRNKYRFCVRFQADILTEEQIAGKYDITGCKLLPEFHQTS